MYLLKPSDATITFDGKLMRVALSGVDIYWDGLSFARIVVAKGSKTCGVCADNNGTDSHIISHILFLAQLVDSVSIQSKIHFGHF